MKQFEGQKMKVNALTLLIFLNSGEECKMSNWSESDEREKSLFF